MLEEFDARRSAAGVSRYAIEVALPMFAGLILAVFVLPQAQGAGRLAAATAVLAIMGHAAIGLVRAQRAVEREKATKAAVTGAAEAIEGAGRATAGVLGLLQTAVIPALDKTHALAEAMTADRRLSAPVRGRAAGIRTANGEALAILRDIAGAPLELPEPVTIDALPAAEPTPKFESLAEDVDDSAFAEPTPGPTPEWAAEVASLDGLRVLVAESNGAHQLLLRTHLAQFGIEPRIVADGVEAIEAWRSEAWDLILLDLQTPRMDGLETAQMIRSVETRFGWASTPIVGLAASAAGWQLDACVEAGMSACVAKPIDGEALFEAMEAALSAPAQPAADLPFQMARVA